METRIKVLGHPVHPMLIVYPLALFSIGVLFDVLYLVTGDEAFAVVAYWTIAAGIVGGVLAALFGLVDWLAIPTGTRAKRIGLWHGAGNAAVVALFVVSWLLRQPGAAYRPDVLPFILGLVAVAFALVTAWLGGELVYRLRVGVDDDAHLDATNSLSEDGFVRAGEPASTRPA